jgi:flagellar hook-length control protein FliK
VPRVASESSVIHAKQHHHLGQRSRSADAESKEQSPFAALVEGTDTPPPTRNRDDRGQSKRASSAEDTQPAERGAPAASRPKSETKAGEAKAEADSECKAEAKTDEAPEDTDDVDMDAKVAAPTDELLFEDLAIECEEDVEAADAMDAAIAAAAATGDATVAQPVPSQPLSVMPTPVAPVAPVVPLTADPAPAEPTSDDGSVDDATSGAVKDAPAGPVKKAELSADVPVIEPKGLPKGHKAPVDKAAATGATETDAQAQTNADAPAADTDAKSAAVADGDKPATPAEAPKPDVPRAVHEHERAHNHIHKADDVPIQPLGAQVSEAAQSARPPAEAVHAMLQANDRPAGANAAAAQVATPTSQDPAVPIAGLAVEIAARAQSGRNRFEIRLDPPELGRIDVRLDVDQSGQVTSRLVVERVETLEHLRRDAADLQRALQDAGLKTADNSLQFTLRDQGFAGRDDRGSNPDSARLVVPDADLATVDAAQNAYGRSWRAGGIDIRV